jgi:hypothetical protein
LTEKENTVAQAVENDEKKLKAQAYGAAEARLRKAHPEEFEQYRAEEYAARGLTYTRRATAREKAEAQIKALLAEYPDLAG